MRLARPQTAARATRRAPSVVALDDPRATDAALTGAKAAALARAGECGLSVLPGFVVTTAAPWDRLADHELEHELERWWRELSEDGRRRLVVRSSSTVEDQSTHSMAGRYRSVVGVSGWDAFAEAVQEVRASRRQAAEGMPELDGTEPLAVLVQPYLEARQGGVIFGVDPVTGRDDRFVAAASDRGADAVVSGTTDATHYVLDERGKVVDIHSTDAGGATWLGWRHRRQLVRLAWQAATIFGGPQDVEWGLDRRGRVVLFQSRPVTTPVRGRPTGALFGRGPVAETFPEPLARLEQDLWVAPLAAALAHALRIAGARGRRADEASLVVVVHGYVALNLTATGEAPPAHRVASKLDPRPPMRRLVSAWRVGRIRAALPALGEDVVHQCDAALASVPPLTGLSDRQLLALLDRAGDALASAHAHEILLGRLSKASSARLTGASVALAALAHARRLGLKDHEIVAQFPVVLALAPPRIGREPLLPPVAEARPSPHRLDAPADRASVAREALRLRVRWLHELTARAATQLGARLVERGLLARAESARQVDRESLRRALLDAVAPELHPLLRDDGLPARFWLNGNGELIADVDGHGTAGTGAGGGRRRGPVSHDPASVEDGDVLIVATLEPWLAPVVARLGGLVAETGSVLAHMAIQAREAGVPVVVGALGARRRFAPGTVVTVDGTTGTIEEQP